MYSRNSIFCSANPRTEVLPIVLTSYLSHDDEGNSCVRVLEKDIDPLSSLSWDDFSLTRLVKAGVDIKSLGITSDLRVGFDAEIDAFNERLLSLSDKIYDVEPKNNNE